MRPDNCPTLTVTRVNPEIWSKLSSVTQSRDIKIQRVTNVITQSMVAIASVAENLVTATRSDEALSKAKMATALTALVDGLALMANANQDLNQRRLDAFNTKALRRIVGVRWHDYVTNASILIRTGQPPLTTTIRKLRLNAFGHICRLQPGTQAIDILASSPPSTWHRPRGRPPLRWADQIVNDTQMSLSDAVTATQDRTFWRSLVRDATRPATQAT